MVISAETGGLLLGYWSGDAMVISEVRAVRTKTSFLPDDGWQTAELAKRYAASGIAV